ncbi:MAG: Crp/Fnr family transcriptional regulator [Cyclobacteriaceae bacterium]|nr:Crp/Fnr family transcriptional regulator [Cyclobacteriaceae bacterium]
MTHHEYFKRFHSITEAEYELLARRFKAKFFAKDEPLLVPGQVQREVYFIKHGVQMAYVDSGKKQHVLAFTYSPNLCANPESFHAQIPSKYFVTCLTASEAEAISFDSLQELFNKSQNLERLFRKMTEVVLAGMINRHIELHALSIEERYKIFCKRSGHLLQLVPHKYIASYLGMDATNFSKLYNQVKI